MSTPRQRPADEAGCPPTSSSPSPSPLSSSQRRQAVRDVPLRTLLAHLNSALMMSARTLAGSARPDERARLERMRDQLRTLHDQAEQLLAERENGPRADRRTDRHDG